MRYSEQFMEHIEYAFRHRQGKPRGTHDDRRCGRRCRRAVHEVLICALHSHQPVGGAEGIGHRGLFAFRQGGPGQVHPQLRDAIIQAGVHLPEIVQNVQVQPAQIVKAVLQDANGGHRAEPHGVGLHDGTSARVAC